MSLSPQSRKNLLLGVGVGLILGPDLATSLNMAYQILNGLGGGTNFNNFIDEVFFFEIGSRLGSPMALDLVKLAEKGFSQESRRIKN